MTRAAETIRTARAGCIVCHGSTAHWLGRNAVGVAARHHDATGHQTWSEQAIRTVYGVTVADGPAHPDLFAEATA